MAIELAFGYQLVLLLIVLFLYSKMTSSAEGAPEASGHLFAAQTAPILPLST